MNKRHPYLFEKEILIVGIRRSGIHAIAQWLFAHTPKKSFIQNNSYFTLKKRTKHGYQAVFPNKVKRLGKLPFQTYFNIVENKSLEFIADRWENPRSPYNTLKRFYARQYHADRFSKQKCIVLVYRSCFNCMASIVWDRGIWKLLGNDFMSFQNSYELEAMNATRILSHKHVILFDRWFTDKIYRKACAKALQFNFTDQALNNIWRFGSSFDKKRFNGKAQQMDVLNRHKRLTSTFYKKHHTFCISMELS